jgi:hypothetical protein
MFYAHSSREAYLILMVSLLQQGFGFQQQLVPGMRPGGPHMPNYFVPVVQQGQQGPRPGMRRSGAGAQGQQPAQSFQQQVFFYWISCNYIDYCVEHMVWQRLLAICIQPFIAHLVIFLHTPIFPNSHSGPLGMRVRHCWLLFYDGLLNGNLSRFSDAPTRKDVPLPTWWS